MTDPTGYFAGTPSWLDPVVNFGLVVIGVAFPVCAPAAMYIGMIYNAASAVSNGASFEQVIATTAISLATAQLGAGFGQAVAVDNIGAQLVGGAVGGAVGAALTTMHYGGNLGENVLRGAAMGAAWAAVSVGVQKVVAVSEAAAIEAEGGSAGDGALMQRGPLPAADGGNLTKSIGGVPFVVDGGSVGEREALAQDLSNQLGNQTGERALAELRSRVDVDEHGGRHVKPFRIHLVEGGSASNRHGAWWTKGPLGLIWNDQHIDVSRFREFYVNHSGETVLFTNQRIIAHEFGHAVFGIGDDGPNNMNNVWFENRWMHEANQFNDRCCYDSAWMAKP